MENRTAHEMGYLTLCADLMVLKSNEYFEIVKRFFCLVLISSIVATARLDLCNIQFLMHKVSGHLDLDRFSPAVQWTLWALSLE